jgi:hypothetical protein
LLASNRTFHSSRLIPRGFEVAEIENRHYIATSINYQLPIWYPEGGLQSVIYFKRIRINAGFDYATFNKHYFIAHADVNKVNIAYKRDKIYSYGGDITFDVNLLSMPAAATSAITLSIYKPHGKKGIFFSAGMGLPF